MHQHKHKGTVSVVVGPTVATVLDDLAQTSCLTRSALAARLIADALHERGLLPNNLHALPRGRSTYTHRSGQITS